MVPAILPVPQALPHETLPFPIKSEESNLFTLESGLASDRLATNRMRQTHQAGKEQGLQPRPPRSGVPLRPRPRRSGSRGRGRWAGLSVVRGSGPAPAPPLPARAPEAPPTALAAPPAVRCAGCRAGLRTMSGLLALLGPAGRGCARVRPRATWFLGAAAPCAPPPVFLPLLRPGPDAQLLRAARRNCHGRQVSLPTPTPIPGRLDRGSISSKGEFCKRSCPRPSTSKVPRSQIFTSQGSTLPVDSREN